VPSGPPALARAPSDEKPPMAPRPEAMTFIDPRPGRSGSVGLIGFYFPGKMEDWDRVCGASFLGNFYDMSPNCIEVTAKTATGRSKTHCFRNAEAAFQALKFWDRAEEFEQKTGQEAFQLKQQIGAEGPPDFTYGGIGNNWQGMLTVLHQKFNPKKNRLFTSALQSTGDAFLLEHNSVRGRDNVWSDNNDGEGKNWLGVMLMLLRDELTGKTGWTDYVYSFMDPPTGAPLNPEREQQWQDTVRSARQSLLGNLAMLMPQAAAAPSSSASPGKAGAFNVCLKPRCGKPTWNGQPNEFCSKACRMSTNLCNRKGCGKPTFNGLPGEFCSKLCRDVVMSSTGGVMSGGLMDDLFGGMFGSSSTKGTGYACAMKGCGKPSWNGQANEFCSKACRSAALKPAPQSYTGAQSYSGQQSYAGPQGAASTPGPSSAVPSGMRYPA